MLGENVWDQYDNWLTMDVVGEMFDTREWEVEWAMSLIRQEHPYLKDDTYVRALAEQRLDEGYYDDYDF